MNKDKIVRAVLAAGLLFVAQARADSVENLLAHAYGLQAMTPDPGQSRYGTYWNILQDRFLMPMPGVPTTPYLQCYSLGDGLSFLVDANTPPTNAVNCARLETDLNEVLGALAQSQEAKLNAKRNEMLGLTSEMDSEDEGESSPQYGPDDLWLNQY